MSRLSDAEIEAIEKRCAAATPGDWEIFHSTLGSEHYVLWSGPDIEKLHIAQVEHESDAEFLLKAHTDIPRLLDDLKAARDALKVCLDAGWNGPLPDYARKQALAALSTYDGKP